MNIGDLNAKITLDTSGFSSGISSVVAGFSKIGMAAIQLNQAADLAMRGLHAMERAFDKVRDACDEYQMSVIKTAAVIASKSGEKSTEGIAKAYEDAKKYAGELYDKLREVNKQTIFSSRDLRLMTSQFQLQGVYIDQNSEKQLKGYASLANALAVITANSPNKEIQIASETRALLRGELRPGDELAKFIASNVPDFKKVVKKKLAEGGDALFEWLGEQTKGFAAASKDIGNTWTAVGTALESVERNVLRKGMGDAFQGIISSAKSFTTFLEDNTDAIASGFKLVWETVRVALMAVWDILVAFSPIWEFIWEVIKGWAMALSLVAVIGIPTIMEGLKGILQAFGALIVSTFEWLKTLGGIGEVLGNIASGQWDAAKTSWEKYKASVTTGFKNIGKEVEGSLADSSKKIEKTWDDANARFTNIFKGSGKAGKAKTPKSSPSKDTEKDKKGQRDYEKADKHIEGMIREAQAMINSKAMDEYEEKMERITEKFEKFAGENAKVLAKHPELREKLNMAEALAEIGAAMQYITDQNKKLTSELEKTAVDLKFLEDTADMTPFQKKLAEATKSVDSQFVILKKHFGDIADQSPETAAAIDKIKESLEKLKAQKQAAEINRAFAEALSQAKEQARNIELDLTNKPKGIGLFNTDPLARQKVQAESEIDRQYAPMLDDLQSAWTNGTISVGEYSDKVDRLVASMDAAKNVRFELIAQEDVDTFTTRIENMTDVMTNAGEAFAACGRVLADSLTTFAQTGKLDIGNLVQGLMKALQAQAAAKTAELLMEAAFCGIRGLIASASNNPVQAGKYYAAATMALQGAAVMGAFVLGSGLANMAHDGIDNVPEEGTWLLDKGERVVDSRTNQDLKDYLKGGGKEPINMTVNINGGNEESVMKALPKLRQVIIETVNGDIASNGLTRKTIQTYAR